MGGGGACGGVQMVGRLERAGGLGGVPLGFAESGDCLGERGQPGEQHDRGERRVFGEVGERGDEPGGAAQLVPGRGGAGGWGGGGGGGGGGKGGGGGGGPARS